jgi:hypothetical protein
VVRRLTFISGALLFGLTWAALTLAGANRLTTVRAAATLCVQPGNLGCYSTISAALAAAQTGDTIRVAAGTYIEYVTINKTVTLQGGWNAGFTVRDPLVNVTMIRPPDASFSVVHIQGQFADPQAVAPTLDGFTITGGGGGNHGGGLRLTNTNALVSNNVITGNLGYLLGGGIWVQNGAPVIQNNRIENNQVIQSSGGWGGGVELEGTRATLIGNVIANNSVHDSVGYGGGVAIEGGGPVTLTNNTIISNSAATLTSAAPQNDVGYGGGVSLENASATLTGNLIQNNTANGVYAFSFGGAFGFGGGVAILNSPAFTLQHNTIFSNTASYKYYLYPSGGGLEIRSSAGTLADNVIGSNHANGNILFGNGGGLAVYTSTLSLVRDQIRDNVTSINCEGYGGGLYARNSAITLEAVRLENNCAANSPFYGLGGGLAFFSSPYTMTNSLVAQNRSYFNDTSVGGLYANPASPGRLINNSFVNNKGQGLRVGAMLLLTNNIIMGHTTGISLTAMLPVTATNNDFYNNTTNQRGFSLNASNVVINPQLDSSYHLQAPSPVIDLGASTNAPITDIDGEPRPMRGTSGLFRFDIGADEFTGAAQTRINLAQRPADFTLIGPGNPQDNPGSTGSNDWIGNAVFGGDINGDQRADLLAGAQNLSSSFDGGPDDDGRVFALFNNRTRRLGVVDLYTATADLEVRSWINQQHIGQAFAASDINGDGQDDLIIGASGAPGFNVLGAVYIFSGGSGLSGTRTLSPTLQADYRILADQNTGTFSGADALAAGQLDSSGPDDIVIGDANATVNGRSQTGAVYVFAGSASFPAVWDLKSQAASLTIYGPTANAELGKVAIGDVNGDGKPDLVARSLGAAYVFYGPLAPGTIDLASQNADLTLGGLSDGRLAVGDVNGDGKADLVVGSGQQVRVYQGDTLGLLATFTGVNASALATLDWNGDGKADIAFGDALNNRAFVVLGSAGPAGTADITESADWYFSGERAGDQLGFGLGSGDLDSDGGIDLILGSRSHVLPGRADPHFNDAGAVYVFYGHGAGQAMRSVYLPAFLKNP